VRPIPNWPDYYISDEGRIYSTKNRGAPPKKWSRKTRKKKIKPRELKTSYLEWTGRFHIRLYRYENGKRQRRMFRVGDLVLRTFDPDGFVPGAAARHVNGILTDNRVSNLYWDTRLGYTTREDNSILE